MIDVKQMAMSPYTHADCNCGVAVMRALHTWKFATQALRDFERLPLDSKVFYATKYPVNWYAQGIAEKYGCPRVYRPWPTPAWGVARFGKARVFSAYDGTRWWAKTRHGVCGMRDDRIDVAWGVPCRQ